MLPALEEPSALADSSAEQNNAIYSYTRWAYDLDHGHTKTFATVTSLQSEAYQNTIVDGAGHVRFQVLDNLGGAGGYRAIWTQ